MKNESLISPTGVFIVEGKKLIPVNDYPPATENYPAGSIGAFVESIGYDYEQIHMIVPRTSNKVSIINFRKWSKVPAMVHVKDKTKPISYSEIMSEITAINWNFEWKLLRQIEDI